MTDAVVPCPYCRCASSVSLYRGKDGLRLDHDCPACGHRSLDERQVLLGCLRHMALSARVLELRASRPDLDEVLCKAVEGAREEAMYRTPAGIWYGLSSKRPMDVAPTPEGECDLFDPRYDHIGDVSAREASDLDDPGYCSEEGCE